MLDALPNCENSDLFTPAEKVALRYADTLAGDHKNADPELFTQLRLHFTESQIIELGLRIGIFLGYGRMLRVLGMTSVGAVCSLPSR